MSSSEESSEDVKQEPISPTKSNGRHLQSPMKMGNGVKEEDESSDDDTALTSRMDSSSNGRKRKLNTSVKDEEESDDNDDLPLTDRKPTPKKHKADDSDDDEDFKHKPKKSKKDKKEKHRDKKNKREVKEEEDEKPLKKKKVVKTEVKKEDEDRPLTKKELREKKEAEEKAAIWKWWEEEPLPDGIKWKTLSHNGPSFAEPYERLPASIKLYYDGEPMPLTEETEEVATFYGRMIDHDYCQKESFNDNFFQDWKKVMTPEERSRIKDLKKCNFKEIDAYFKMKSEERKMRTKEQKEELKAANAKIVELYGFCMMDGHKQKVGNFKIEPPGLFRGRGDHPKQGKHKRRVPAEDVTINIGKGEAIPVAPEGHKWKAVQHDNTVSWLACWIENIAGAYKYVMLNPAARLKGEKDWQKYETARKLKTIIGKIREIYQADMTSKEMSIRQRAVALYFIDKLALRAGHEKDEGEAADTVGCCSLRTEHILLSKKLDADGKEAYNVHFDFLGKDSMQYENDVLVDKRVYKNLQHFQKDKSVGDDLFDRLNSGALNKHLSDIMPGLSAKVFRTYNASSTLQERLNTLTNKDDSPAEKFLTYNRANRDVALLCNHQRTAPKTFDKTMENLMTKLAAKKKEIKQTRKEIKALKIEYHEKGKSETVKRTIDQKKAKRARLEEQLEKQQCMITDKNENKEVALGTSKLNYLDPRISIAWCTKNEVDIGKVYSKTHREKFQWAIDMTDEDFQF